MFHWTRQKVQEKRRLGSKRQSRRWVSVQRGFCARVTRQRFSPGRRCFLFRLQPITDYTRTWLRKGQKPGWKSWNWSWEAFHSHPGNFVYWIKSTAKINRHIHDTSVFPALFCLLVWNDFISLALDDWWLFSWGIFSIALNRNNGQTQFIFV